MADMLGSLVDLATLLGKTDDDPLDNASGTLAIEASTAVVQGVIGYRIVRLVDVADEIVVTGWSSYLRLRRRPVISVASVDLDGTAISSGTASGTYRVAGDSLYRSTGWLATSGEPSVATVVYTSGLLAADQDIQLARSFSLSLAASVYENPTGAESERIDDYAVTYAKAAAAMEASPAMRSALRRQYGRRAGLVTI